MDHRHATVSQRDNGMINLSPLRPMRALQMEHAHNPNLVKQFAELSTSFRAWRPVRGDGNCYYRAVLCAWLERTVALGSLDHMRALDALLRPHQNTPILAGSVKMVRQTLLRWIAKRSRCTSDAAVRALLAEVVDEFNKQASDHAFILCLRHLIAQHLKAHAHELVVGQADVHGGLTYESWAIAITGAKDIGDYCERFVYVMGQDAADHVQHVCPRVLHIIVRICMADRATANMQFIDYGQEPSGPLSGGYAAAEEAEPGIFLLLKPGHYDILVRDDEVGRLVDATGVGAAPASFHKSRHASEELTEEANRPALMCGDAPVFSALLSSFGKFLNVHYSDVMERLPQLLEACTEPPVDTNEKEDLLLTEPVGLGFKHSAEEDALVTRPVGNWSDPLVIATKLAWEMGQLSGPAAAAAPASDCCICMRPGATAVAECGCAYHAACLAGYIRANSRAPQDSACHLHHRAFGLAFVSPYFAHSAAPSKVCSPPVDVSGPPGSIISPSWSSDPAVFQVNDDIAMPPPTYLRMGEVALQQPPTQMEIKIAGRLLAVPLRLLPATRSDAPPLTSHVPVIVAAPCAICFCEDGVLKSLHCGSRAHAACLKKYWLEKVSVLGRTVNIHCPADGAGCTAFLTEQDLQGIIGDIDVAEAERRILEVEKQNQQLIEELGSPATQPPPTFQCAICLVEHEVEGCCTLPCQHRFCFQSLEYHFDIIVRERRLSKLTCPADGCGCDLRTEESIHILQHCLSKETYNKLFDFLARENPHIHECQHPGCEERVFLDDGGDVTDLGCPRGHRFCGNCQLGPHTGMSCQEREEQVMRERQAADAQTEHEDVWRGALAMGWKPCPRRCKFGGGVKAAEECDHVTCECGFEFCWDCGVERQVPLAHDNRWHKPSCRYHTRPSEVREAPRHVPNCPECKKLPPGVPCPFPGDDGYPRISRQSRMSRR